MAKDSHCSRGDQVTAHLQVIVQDPEKFDDKYLEFTIYVSYLAFAPTGEANLKYYRL